MDLSLIDLTVQNGHSVNKVTKLWDSQKCCLHDSFNDYY